MNKKFLPRAVLFIIAFVLSNLASLTQVKAQVSTFYGLGAGNNNSGDYNSGFGYNVLYSGNSGVENTAIGDSALFHDSTGDSNTASGALTLYNNTTGNYNTASGYHALNFNTTGDSNTPKSEPVSFRVTFSLAL